MKSILRVIPVLLATATLANAQEEVSSSLREPESVVAAPTTARILGKIPDGTPPPPAPPKPEYHVAARDILNTTTHEQGGRTITIRQIKPIDLPEPPEPASSVEITDELRQRIAEYREKHPYHQPIALGATVYRLENDTTRSLVSVWMTGQKEPVSFWSSGDFSLLSGIGAFATNQGETRALFMLWSIHDTNRFAKRMAELGRAYKRPQIPDLPSDRAAYVITNGEPGDDLLAAIDSLHEILDQDATKLRQAYEGRAQAAKEREEYLKLNPPQPKDITLNYWRTETPATAGKGAAK